METELHPAIPREITTNLGTLLDETLEDLGFGQFDNETSPEVHQAVSIVYFFKLGCNIVKRDPTIQMNELSKGLFDYLQKAKLVEPKPRDYKELTNTFQKLFSETSRYLTGKV